MKGSIAAPAKVMKIRAVQQTVAGSGLQYYAGRVSLTSGEQWIATMVSTHGSAHAGYVDSYNGTTGDFILWFTDMVPEGTTIKVWGFVYKTE